MVGREENGSIFFSFVKMETYYLLPNIKEHVFIYKTSYVLDSCIIPYGTLLIINWGILITIIEKWFRSDNDANIKKLYVYFIKYIKINNERFTYYQCSKVNIMKEASLQKNIRRKFKKKNLKTHLNKCKEISQSSKWKESYQQAICILL